VGPLQRSAAWAVLATAAAVAGLLLATEQRQVTLRLYAVALGAIALQALFSSGFGAHARDDGPRLLPGFLRRRPPAPDRPRQLEELEHAAGFALGTAFDVHYRLRPHLAAIAADRLARRGVSLDRSPEAARRLLGPDAWELVQPDRPAPQDRNSPGIPLARLRAAVSALDAL
jgi:hypothetical protein